MECKQDGRKKVQRGRWNALNGDFIDGLECVNGGIDSWSCRRSRVLTGQAIEEMRIVRHRKGQRASQIVNAAVWTAVLAETVEELSALTAKRLYFFDYLRLAVFWMAELYIC